MSNHISDFFNPLTALQHNATRFCKFESVRDLIWSYSNYQLQDLLRSNQDELEELMDHWESIDQYADSLIRELKGYELYELCAKVQAKQLFYSKQLESIAAGL